MTDPTTVDLRGMEPRLRHPLVFKTFDGLAPGEALLLVNDHDPKPLFYQFQAERPGEAEWEPQEAGPERWVIRIVKQGAGG
ncbi:MAG: hemerythrin [Chloroflexi bacterium HGW-Chloroflexi-9]|nr:MAG: hemerythrin [Chloroflexi bacterium HGW-Chloroflexi-9]